MKKIIFAIVSLIVLALPPAVGWGFTTEAAFLFFSDKGMVQDGITVSNVRVVATDAAGVDRVMDDNPDDGYFCFQVPWSADFPIANYDASADGTNEIILLQCQYDAETISGREFRIEIDNPADAEVKFVPVNIEGDRCRSIELDLATEDPDDIAVNDVECLLNSMPALVVTISDVEVCDGTYGGADNDRDGKTDEDYICCGNNTEENYPGARAEFGEPLEQCDDDNTDAGDGCDATCHDEFCGDGIDNDGTNEECDDGNNNAIDGCDATCHDEFCGDGIDNDGTNEQCDDGNNVSLDGCDATCHDEFCGDGIDNDGTNEECDDGNNNALDGCNATCQLESCGDGIVNNSTEGLPAEQCDDGNATDGDGCNNNCTLTVRECERYNYDAVNGLRPTPINDGLPCEEPESDACNGIKVCTSTVVDGVTRGVCSSSDARATPEETVCFETGPEHRRCGEPGVDCGNVSSCNGTEHFSDKICLITYNIPLNAGNNWISLPLDVWNNNTGAVTNDPVFIMRGLTATGSTATVGFNIQHRDPSSGFILSYTNRLPIPKTLTQMTPMKNYILNVSLGSTLTIQGVRRADQRFTLTPGENWVGFGLHNADAAAGDIGVTLQQLTGLDNIKHMNSAGNIMLYEPPLDEEDSLRSIKPGKGYILRMNGTGEIEWQESAVPAP
ncbi:MAG: DUF4215 domain-containing protein [Deltaproteobacteria bacterium]|nr:DUF4215 domain-containing protein [Deltaproteobacteria bacterium]